MDLPVDERQVRPRGCAGDLLDDAAPQAVAATYSFRAPESADPYTVAVRFVGVNTAVGGTPGPGDRFERTERLEGLVGDGGRVALTTRATNLTGGEWRVLAEPVVQPDVPPGSAPLPRRVLETRTRFGLLAQGPAVRLAAWPALVGLGAVVALVVQSLLARDVGIGVLPVLLLSLLGCALGFVGGKLWYLGLHRKPLREFVHAGACIQGFLLVALGVLAIGSLLLGLEVGTVLDVSTPGIFLGVAVGRPGCWLTGCCAGRPTASTWGLVSSDRRLTIRRVPVQLYEALSGLAIGLVSLAVVLWAGSTPHVPGAVFVGAVAIYTLVRQLLFPYRVESRTRKGRLVTIAVCGLVFAAAVATFLV